MNIKNDIVLLYFRMIQGMLSLLFSVAAMAEPIESSKQKDYQDISGYYGSFSDHHGQWVVINYWAIWCSPCIKEIPELNKFAALHSEDVVVFGVNYDQATVIELIEYANELNIQFPVLIDDPAQLLALPGPQVLPVTYVINPAGRFTQTLLGPQTLTTLEQAIQ